MTRSVPYTLTWVQVMSGTNFSPSSSEGAMSTFSVTFHYLGHDWFLAATAWTDQPERASNYATQEAASMALTRVRRYMRNKQIKARIVATTPGEERCVEHVNKSAKPGRTILHQN
jgi:hypothetical protein